MAQKELVPDGADLLRVGSLELDPVNYTGRRGDRSFDLRRREARLLAYLMERRGRLLTHAQILRDLWPYRSVPEATNVGVLPFIWAACVARLMVQMNSR